METLIRADLVEIMLDEATAREQRIAEKVGHVLRFLHQFEEQGRRTLPTETVRGWMHDIGQATA